MMADYTTDYNLDTPEKILDLLKVARYFRYHPDSGLLVGRVTDAWRALSLSAVQIKEIDPRLVLAFEYYFSHDLEIAPLIKESIRLWSQPTLPTPFPVAHDVTNFPKRPDLSPALWSQNTDSIILRERLGEKLIVVRGIDLATIENIDIVVRAETRLLTCSAESFEALQPGACARYLSALAICESLQMPVAGMLSHIFPIDIPAGDIPELLATTVY